MGGDKRVLGHHLPFLPVVRNEKRYRHWGRCTEVSKRVLLSYLKWRGREVRPDTNTERDPWSYAVVTTTWSKFGPGERTLGRVPVQLVGSDRTFALSLMSDRYHSCRISSVWSRLSRPHSGRLLSGLTIGRLSPTLILPSTKFGDSNTIK